MNKHSISVKDIEVEIVRKDIKNMHLAVYPPDGRVRVAAPRHITDDNIRLTVIARLSWIKKQLLEFENQRRQTEREMVSGECHYIFGKPYRLEVVFRIGKHEFAICNNSTLKLYVNPETSASNRQRLLYKWYREQLKKRIPDLIHKWERKIGVTVHDYGIKRMKTKWGSCNIEKRRIWINLELAKKSPQCLEYIIVHEMVHLLERLHNERFKMYMNKFLPHWRLSRDLLKAEPLAHEDWKY